MFRMENAGNGTRLHHGLEFQTEARLSHCSDGTADRGKRHTVAFKVCSHPIMPTTLILAGSDIPPMKLGIPAVAIQSAGPWFLLAKAIGTMQENSMERKESREPSAHRSTGLLRRPKVSYRLVSTWRQGISTWNCWATLMFAS